MDPTRTRPKPSDCRAPRRRTLPDHLGFPGRFTSRGPHYARPIRQDYGATETGTIAIDTATPVQEGCVGEPLPHLEVRLAPWERVSPPQQETVEIQVRSSVIARWYLSAGRLRPCLDSDGWYHTSDAGSFDRTGRLWLGQRLRPPLQVNGGSVDPEAIEAAIHQHPGVQEVVVIGIRDEQGRPRTKAVVVAPGLRTAELETWYRKALSPELRPAVTELCEELPRSPAGKILQKYLR